MKLNKCSGATIAAAAAALMVSGAVAGSAMAASHGAKSEKVKCWNVNACKGKTGCGTSANACAGQNACKGKGWVKMDAKACDAIGGSTEEKKS